VSSSDVNKNQRVSATVTLEMAVMKEMSVISTYLNDNAQTPVNRFVVYMLYNKFATNTVKNRNDGA